MRRRRFLQIVASAAALAPGQGLAAGSAPTTWRGQALGAEVSVTLAATPDEATADRVLSDLPNLLRDLEQNFSLYDPQSALSALNRDGRLHRPSAAFTEVLHLCDLLHRASGGLFDPTVQPVWQALAQGKDPTLARQLIGWDRVRLPEGAVYLDAGQRLTLNGIAQGYATDQVRQLLADAGYSHALINIGEHAALGGPWRIGIEDAQFGLLAERRLTGRAIATSGALATLVGGQSHILHPKGGGPEWSTVSVEAQSAAVADGLSTAMVLAGPDAVRSIISDFSDVYRVVLVDRDGNLSTIG